MAANRGSTLRETIEGHSAENNSYLSTASFTGASGFRSTAWCPLILTVVAYGNHIFAKAEEYFLTSVAELSETPAYTELFSALRSSPNEASGC